jgi:hypothetical protein
MASNKIIRFGPVALTATLSTTIINTAITSLSGPAGYTQTQPYVVIRHVRIVNKTSGAATCTFYIGASGGTAAGTEVIGNGLSVSANSYIDWYGALRLDSGDYLTGGASAGTTLTFEAEGEIGIS